MTSSPVYTIAPTLGEFYVDSLGLPLAGGSIAYFSDINRSTPKAVYNQTGSPPNYTYAALPNPLDLGVNGMPVYLGIIVKPFYNLVDALGDPELYYVEVFDSNNVLKLQLEGWPNQTMLTDASANEELFNFIPNGQFLLHNAVPDPITETVTQIAPGGWTYERSTNSSTDIVSFFRYDSYVVTPQASPRYAAVMQCTSAFGGESFKRLCVQFNDVNKFASTTQQYTFTFTCSNNVTSSFSAQVYLLKDFGTGGSSTTLSFLGNVTVTSTLTVSSFTFVFDDNNGQNIGSLDDDYLQIVIDLPATSLFTFLATDFSLVIGDIANTTFPQQTNRDMAVRSNSPPLPAYDGSNLYLPIIQGPDGLIYDTSQIGLPYPSFQATPSPGSIVADGSTFIGAAQSADGIPYARLQAAYMQTGFQPLFGTGSSFVSCGQMNGFGGSQYLSLISNAPGTTSPVTDGAVPTGFTFTQVVAAQNTIGFKAYKFNSISVLVQGPSLITPVGMTFNPGTSSFTAKHLIHSDDVVTTTYDYVICPNTSPTGYASQYFKFNNVGTSTTYYDWFKVNGTGTDPAPGGTGILINTLSLMTADVVTSAIMASFSGCQHNFITCVAGSAITAGAYFKFSIPSTGVNFLVYYIVDSTGVDPALSGYTSIPVSISSANTSTQVASATLEAINSYSFSIPDLRGLSLRGNDPTKIWDVIQDYGGGVTLNTRFNLNPNLNSSGVGTLELYANLSHDHQNTYPIAGSTAVSANVFTLAASLFASTPIYTMEPGSVGFVSTSSESRPVNMAVNYFIKY